MPATDYVSFDLLITQGPTSYQARVIRSPAGDAKAEFALPFGEEVLKALLRFSGQTRDLGAVLADESGSFDPQGFGSRLYGALFAGEVDTCLQASLAWTHARGVGLRIRLRFDGDLAELADLPWEYLYAPDLGRFLALSDDTPLVRYLEVRGSGEAQPVRPPLVVLALLSNPADTVQLAVDGEWRQLQEAVRPLQERRLLQLEVLPVATVEALQARLRRGPVHVLHFVGHGYFDPAANQGGLAFEDSQQRAHLVSAGTLGMLLHDHEPLRLAFLNACQGAVSGRSDSFAGVAQRLVQQGVPAVLAMQFPISDQAGIALSQEFYRALTDGYPADAALSEARKAIAAHGDSLEWATPVLFSRSDDNRLLELPQGDAQPVIGRQPWEPETVLIPGGPFLMGSSPGQGVPDAETPQHEVSVPDFRIGRFPVTHAQYERFLRENRSHDVPRDAGWFNRQPASGLEDHPVWGVSWADAVAYCRWLSQQTGRRYRLPSEAEWEKAASWGGEASGEQEDWARKRMYPWGGEWVEGRCNVASAGTTAVGEYADGASAHGVEDLLGNVQEWTRSLWGSGTRAPDFGYPYDPADGREVEAIEDLPAQMRVVHRGGSYRSQPDQVSNTRRGHAAPGSRIGWRGFRVAMEV